MRAAGVLLSAALAAVAVAGDLLVRVEPKSDADIETATTLNASFLGRFDGWFLARVRTEELATLSGRLGCRVLDADIESKRYVYAFVEPGFDRQRLAGCGVVLTEDREGVLLRTTEAGIKEMNGLPVELCGVSTEPVLSSPTPNPQAPTSSSVPDSLIWQLMARASQDSAEAVLRRLIAFHTRYAYTESCWSAARWYQTKLAAYDCDTTYLDTFDAALGPNVIGLKRGRANPNQVYIVCGHIDDASEMPETFAPGSDDNASGAGLVLEVARILADMDFDYTVWFIGFGGEEQGLVGSESFARRCRERGDTLVLAINHDMDSYGTAGRDSIRVVGKRTDPPCSTWVEYYMAMADTFTDLKCHREIVDDQGSSDQHSFWDYGYTAIRDRYLDIDPVYHTTGDTIGPFEYVMCGTNNIPMYTEAIKATVATVAKLAGAHQHVGIEESPEPQATSPRLTVAPSVGLAPVSIRLSSVADVSVYNTAGRLIRILSGSALVWDGCDFSGAAASPGVYHFRAAGASARFVLAR